MKKSYGFWILAAAICCCFSLVGCKSGEEHGFRVYENAAAYTAGDFICESAAVRRVEIDWPGGNVEIEQSGSDKTSVVEEEKDLPEEKRLHTSLRGGVLYVKYCRSGCLGKIDEVEKNLQVQIPKGIDVEINGVSANVYFGVVETGELSVETESGCVEAESLVCKSADIETHGGYIGIGALTADKTELDSVSGDIHLNVPCCRDVEIETKNGHVSLYLQGDVSALIDFETRTGELQTERQYERQGKWYLFPATEIKEGAQGASVRITVETEKGNLRVQ